MLNFKWKSPRVRVNAIITEDCFELIMKTEQHSKMSELIPSIQQMQLLFYQADNIGIICLHLRLCT